jgi:hypothetical protein
MAAGAAAGKCESHRSRSSRESDISTPMAASDIIIEEPP